MAFIEPCFGTGHNLSLICQMTSEDIKHQLIILSPSPASLFPHLHAPFPPFSPSLISLVVSVGVKHHVYLLNIKKKKEEEGEKKKKADLGAGFWW